MHLAGLGPRRQHPVVGEAGNQPGEGNADHEQQGHAGDGHRDRSPDNSFGPAVPEPVLDRLDAVAEHAALLDPLTEQRQQRGQDDHRAHAGGGDDAHARIGKRP